MNHHNDTSRDESAHAEKPPIYLNFPYLVAMGAAFFLGSQIASEWPQQVEPRAATESASAKRP